MGVRGTFRGLVGAAAGKGRSTQMREPAGRSQGHCRGNWVAQLPRSAGEDLSTTATGMGSAALPWVGVEGLAT